MKTGVGMRAALAAVLFLCAATAHSKDLLDYIIEAYDPQLAPARPLIECLAGGGNVAHCATEAAKTQAGGVLPISANDNRIKLVVAIFDAARQERWLDVVTIGGETVARSVSCAMLPLAGSVKATACDVIGWVITKNAAVLDQVWHALTGPDWWALVKLLPDVACQFIPSEGAAGYAKDALCGPLAAAIDELKQWADTMAQGVVDGADAVEKIVFGDDSHMPPQRYYDLYFTPWYHYSTARVFKGESLGPAIGNLYSYCVNYFDSHNQYKSTAKKTCNDLKAKFDKTVMGFAAALPVSVNGFFETVALPAIRGAARAAYGKPASEKLPGEDFFVSNCEFQMRTRFPFPDPDDTNCKLLDSKAKDLASTPFGTLHANFAAACYSQFAQQTVTPTVWAMACDDMRYRYKQAFAGESLKIVAVIGQLKGLGCAPADPAKTDKLRIDCPTFAGVAHCLQALGPNGDTWCAKKIVTVADADQGGGTVAASDPALPPPAEGSLTPDSPTDNASASRTVGGAGPRDGAVAPRTPATAADSGQTSRDVPALQRVVPTQVLIEGEQLVTMAVAAGGRVASQDMGGFGRTWGGGRQLFWTGGEPGAVLDLPIDVPQSGLWSVILRLTRAPDYADLQFEVGGRRSNIGFSGYAQGVDNMDAPLGTFSLDAGRQTIAIMIVGRKPASTNYFVGVDRVTLIRLGDAR